MASRAHLKLDIMSPRLRLLQAGRFKCRKIDDDYYDFVPDPEMEEGEEEEVEMTAGQISAVAAIQRKGLHPHSQSDGYFHFIDEAPPSGLSRTYRSIDMEHLTLAAESIEDFDHHEEHRGITNRDRTYTEVLVTLAVRYKPLFQTLLWTVWSEATSCIMGRPVQLGQTMKSDGSGPREVGFHVCSSKDGICIELSPAPPFSQFLILDLPVPRASKGEPVYTLKVYTSAGDPKVNEMSTQTAIDGMLFELAARHKLTLSVVPRERPSITAIDQRGENDGPLVARYPQSKLPREVASLFSFAAEVHDNLPYTFLSYYQALEFYFPWISRRNAIRAVRREIYDFSFEASDDNSVLRILNVVERSKAAGEEEQMKLLLRECVREDKLIEFLSDAKNEQHFSRRGPISGAPEINPKNANESVSLQATKRIYALRNRIVHAKDDPKYSAASQLLPRSKEAHSLNPDILLVRLLAQEVVIATQAW
ncbi:hypothetical protein ACFVJ8_00825 [Streptomyces yangpuensis]|uniref:hypothetical protein n=1 Tax=Streptomyces yangpuensis TaxID=1648182 RepID=UPI0036381960